MLDYYDILSRAVRTPAVGDSHARGAIYDRARQMLATQMRSQRVAPGEMRANRAALEAAIERIEREISDSSDVSTADEPEAVDALPPDTGTDVARPLWARPVLWGIAAVVVAALGAGIYVLRAPTGKPAAPKPAADTAARPATPPAREPASRTPLRPAGPTIATVEDLAPGVDGGANDASLPYFYRRQPVFYRTTHPAGTVIVDKAQRFLYLIQPNNVALRYGIAVGVPCSALAGLRRITRKAEWPEWQPPQDMIDRRLVKAGTMAGGPGNPLGARVLDLDDNVSRIHGTNAPKTIGNAVTFGCVRLVNDDIVDLYNRVPTGTRVIISD